MVFLNVLFSFLAIGILGGLLGIGLAFASKMLAAKKDERIAQIEEILPGLNCGACGYAGCSAYAEAIANDGEEVTLCSPGGKEVAQKLAEFMGVKVDVNKEKMVAQVHCRGKAGRTEYKFTYQGLEDCNALYMYFQGDKACPYGCLGLGSCIKVCPVNAIDYDEAGLVWVDRDKCITCGKCIEICPTGVIRYIPYSADYIVACNSKDKAKVVRKICKVGCIACKLCEKKSPDGGYNVENNLSQIDYSAKGERENGAKACPTKCIIPAHKTTEELQKEESHDRKDPKKAEQKA